MPLSHRPSSAPATARARSRHRIAAGLIGLASGLWLPLIAGCDVFENPDDIQNSTNNAFVEAQLFSSRNDRTPVEGVIMIVESDPDSDRPFQGPDQSFVSDRNGVVRAAVFPASIPMRSPRADPRPRST